MLLPMYLTDFSKFLPLSSFALCLVFIISPCISSTTFSNSPNFSSIFANLKFTVISSGFRPFNSELKFGNSPFRNVVIFSKTSISSSGSLIYSNSSKDFCRYLLIDSPQICSLFFLCQDIILLLILNAGKKIS